MSIKRNENDFICMIIVELEIKRLKLNRGVIFFGDWDKILINEINKI